MGWASDGEEIRLGRMPTCISLSGHVVTCFLIYRLCCDRKLPNGHRDSKPQSIWHTAPVKSPLGAGEYGTPYLGCPHVSMSLLSPPAASWLAALDATHTSAATHTPPCWPQANAHILICMTRLAPPLTGWPTVYRRGSRRQKLASTRLRLESVTSHRRVTATDTRGKYTADLTLTSAPVVCTECTGAEPVTPDRQWTQPDVSGQGADRRAG